MSYRFEIITTVVFVGLMICMCVTVYTVKRHDTNATLLSDRTPTIIYVCPQFRASSSEYFRVNFTNDFVLNYTKLCRSDDILLVYILSKADHFQRRQAIRRTWADRKRYVHLFDTCFVFLVGLAANRSINSAVISEARIANDIVQVDVEETYRNIVYKEVAGLKWSRLYASQIPFLFKTDDDIVVDTLLLSEAVMFFQTGQTDRKQYLDKHEKTKQFMEKSHPFDKLTLFRGIAAVRRKTMRRGKFGLNSLAWNADTLPDYCRGSGYLFTSFIRDRLYRASLCYATDYIPWMGDLFVSGSLASAAAVQCGAWSLGYSQTSDGCSSHFENEPDLLLCSTPMHTGRMYLEDYDHAWNAILRRHSITNRSIEKAKRRRLNMFKIRADEQLLIRKSIIEQMEEADSQGAPIVPLNQMEEELDN